MAECIECKKFTKYNGGLCIDCYNTKKSYTAVVAKISDTVADHSNDEKEAGLAEKERKLSLWND